MGAVLCPSCGFENPEGFRFCGSCGSALGRACPNCGTENPDGFRFCGSCGQELDRPAADAVLTERRSVTVLFADLVGFSTLAEHLDPEELRTLMTGTFAELTAEVERREGSVEKFIGDAIMAVFGAPQAHEDDPARAVETALSMLAAVRLRSERAPTPLELRIGINSGLVVSGTVGDGTQTGVMGDAVNVAARLQQAAGPGEVLVSDTVWRRVRDRYQAGAVGQVEVKGRERPVEAHRITGTKEIAARRQAPFVGRRDELALLELLWSSAAKSNTHVVSLVGEPGVGKSRLLSELPIRDDALDIRITCGGERAFGPFLDLIDRLLGGVPGDVDDLKRRSADAGVDQETALLLAAFLGLGDAPPVVRMADEQQKRQVFAGVWQFLLAVRGERPALIVFDDVHWADLSSLDLLGFLLERLGAAPMLILLSHRPGFDRVERTTMRASHTGIRLEALSPEESVALARGFLGVRELPEDLERLVATRAEGNPFFIEELLQALLELGSLGIVDGRAVLAKVEVEIPDTVQGTILARVDRLGGPERGVLQHAAVLGRSFSAGLIGAVLDGGEVGEALEQLARAQLLVAEGPDRWAFKHALIQEVTYETLLMRQRKALHAKVAAALEALGGDDPAALELLAEHYARAEVPEKAREYAVRAGDLARQRMGLIEAKERYETALRLWGEGDESGRLELLMKLGYAAAVGGNARDAITALLEAEAGWRGLGDMRRAGASLASLARVYWVTGEVDRAAGVLRQAIELLEPFGSTAELVQAYVRSSTLNMLGGRIDESERLAETGLRMAEDLGLDDARSHLLNNLGACRSFRGDPRGVELIREALELAKRSGEAEAIGRAYTNLPNQMWEFAENREGVALCREGREIMRRLGSPGFDWFIAGNEAGMLADLGEYEAAESLAREALAQARAMRTVPGMVNTGIALATVLVRRGAYEEARRVLDEVLPLARRVGGAEFLSPVLLVESELEQARGNRAAAANTLEEAVELCTSTPAFVYLFRVLAPVARLLPRERASELLDVVRDRVHHDAQRAPVREAEAIIAGDRKLFERPAELYAKLELPYHEARCRLEGGELDRARELIERFGFQDGPLGDRLRQLART